jgi:hypothetical protein
MGDLNLYFNLTTPRLIMYQTNTPIAAAATTTTTTTTTTTATATTITTTLSKVGRKMFPSSNFREEKIVEISNAVDINDRGLQCSRSRDSSHISSFRIVSFLF